MTNWGKLAAFTDLQGKADITALKGVDQIAVSFLGYRTLVFSFEALRSKGFEVGLSLNPFSLGEISVSALRWQQDARDVPHKVRTIRQKEVWLQNPQTAADLLGLPERCSSRKASRAEAAP